MARPADSVPTLGALLGLTADQPTRSLTDGELLVDESGVTVDQLFVLVEGTLMVLKGDMPITVVSEPGSVIGEMAMLLGATPSATVRAVGDVQVRVIDEPLPFLRSNPDLALGVARLLARRLATVTSYLADIKVQFADRDDHLGLVDEVLDALVHDQSADAEPGSARDPDPSY
jgi:CRP/FNR family cyclic AMP-dependent transcriptional regulator